MKTVYNRKTWDENGWTYRMKRLVNGKLLGNYLMISKHEMHYRDGVASKLRKARFDLHIAVCREKYPLLFNAA